MNSLFAFVLLSLLAAQAFAWGQTGHTISSDAATFGVPTEMPAFFHRAYPRLTYLGFEPDRWHSGGEALNAVGFPDHFIDLEYTEGLTLGRSRYDFMAKLEATGRLRQFSLTNTNVGFLPWRIAELSEQLEVQWRLWRAAEERFARHQIEENIIHVAGLLGHYVADGANPLHTTMHYNGWADAENPQRFRTDCDTHSRFESTFVSANINRLQVYPLLGPPLSRGNGYFDTALTYLKESHALVETLYTIDRDGGFDGAGNAAGRDFAIRRLASGASMLRDLWYTTYVNSATPRPRRDW